MSTPEENGEGGESQETKEGVEPEPTDIESEAPEQSESIDEPKVDDDETNDAEEPPKEEDGEPILEPHENDILNGRGASVNAHRGNTKFRALCFSRKPEFEAGNHAVKRRIAAEIVNVTKALPGRFLKRRNDKGPWYEISTEKAILKACQVMRDFQRPDRLALREMASANGARKRQRTSESTPGVNLPIPAVPLAPIVENPYGVHDHDVLSGRGAFVNGHVGNERFRQLAIDRKPQFDAGNYSEKRALATEVVNIIRSLDPPGRFLKRVTSGGNKNASSSNDSPANKEDEEGSSLQARGLDGGWEELSDDRAIHKACQVMRDLNRPDRAAEKKSYTRKTKQAVANGSEIKEEQEDDEKASSGDESADVQDGTEAADEVILGSDEVLDKSLVLEGDKDLDDEEKEQVEVMQV